ncbi:MAG: hypothetical protein M3Q45_08255 [Chloroflexota bacterium]|nr:hypothetical protein [Chloroflexota bacterium]
MKLGADHKYILCALAGGSRLQDHRTVEGDKVYKLHPLDEAPGEMVVAATVDYLQRHGLIDSNMKFPAATYLLTDKGATVAATLTGAPTRPLTTKKYAG